VSADILFITGTDTGVGKTVFTSLLLSAARRSGIRTFALKPFCSGGRSDAELLSAVQEHELPVDEVNPFYFPEPITSLLAARKRDQTISLSSAAAHIRSTAKKCDLLLIEGAGGLLAPLGETMTRTRSKPYSNLQMIQSLGAELLLVAANKLGTINHTLLTLDRAQREHLRVRGVILSDTSPLCARIDPSTTSNCDLLRELIPASPVFHLPHLAHPSSIKAIYRAAKTHASELLALVRS
jgi:dethiobiotin synthetase